MGEQRDAYLEKFKDKLEQWNSEIEQLQLKAAGSKEEAFVSFSKRIEALKEKRELLKIRMEELRTRGDRAWEDLREGRGTSWKAMGDSIEDPEPSSK